MKNTNYYKTKKPLAIFLSYYRAHIKLFILDMCCAIFAAAVDLAFPFFSRMSMQTFLPEQRYKTFFTVMFIFIAAYIIRSVMFYLITYWGHTFGVRVEADMRRDIFAHMQDMSHSFYDENRTGVLMSRVTNDLFEIAELAHHGPEDVIIATITLIGSFCVLCTIEWRLALVLFVVLPLFFVFSLYARRHMHAANVEVKAKTAEINAAVESGISGARTAKAFTNEDEERHKFNQANEKFKRSKSAYYRAMGIFMAGMEFATSFLSVLVITAGGYFIMRGSVNYIDLITFSLYVSIFINPIRKLSNFVEQYIQGMAGFTRFLDVMRREPEIQDAEDAVELPEVKGEVRFNAVSFEYSEGLPVLRDVSVEVPPGKCLAVVGPSGGGKTTLCQLVPRFYDVTAGSVTVDGHDVRSVTQRSLRKNIGIVQQDVFIFAGTILENIRYGKPEASEEEVIEAAKLAEIHHEIEAMPDGYNTYVGERGVMLSGGQKQRLSIARIFLKNPPILILDEATSALDSVTEAHIQAAFDKLSKGRTSIIIAHRLSTIRNADIIAVIDDERIMEMGSHEELMKKEGLYSKLVMAQALLTEHNMI